MLAILPWEKKLEELRYNPYHDPNNGRFTSGNYSGKTFMPDIRKRYSDGGSKPIDKTEKSDTIKSYPEIRFNPYHDAKGKFASGITIKLPNGKEGRLANNGLVTKIVEIAGHGKSKPVKIAEGLSKRFHNKPSDWSKFRGDGYVTYPDGETRHVELHWFLSKQNAVFDFKVKRELQ